MVYVLHDLYKSNLPCNKKKKNRDKKKGGGEYELERTEALAFRTASSKIWGLIEDKPLGS